MSIAAGIIALVFYWGATNAPPYDWTQCYEKTGPTKVFAIYIQVGERHGELNVSFMRIPNDFGNSLLGRCRWPFYVQEDVPGGRGSYYTRIYSSPPNDRQYNMGDFFDVWGSWLASTNVSLPSRPIYFSFDGAGMYRTRDFEMLVHRGPVIDPKNDNYTSTVQVTSYETYVPQHEDYIELIVHEPYQTMGSAYA